MSHSFNAGILMHYYRKKANIKTKEFLVDIDKSEVCSVRTLRNIEKGNVHKIEYVDILCRKINKIFSLDPKLDEKIEKINDSLLSALEKMSVDDLKSIYQQLKDIKINKNVIYYYECILLYRDIINYHLFNIIPESENVEIFKVFLNTNNPKLYKIVLSFLYSISNINTVNVNKKEIFEKCLADIEQPIFFVPFLVNIYNHNSIFNSYLIYKNMLENENLNLYQKTYLKYMIALCLLNGHDGQSAYELLKDTVEHTPKNYFPNEFIVRIYCCMGICAHKIREYEIASNYFKKAYDMNASKINYNYLLYFDSLQNLNKQNDLIQLCNEIDLSKIQNPITHNIISYFRVKYQNIPTVSKYSIIEHILTKELIGLTKFGDEYSDILYRELIEICNITGNYQHFKLFEKSN